MGDFGHAHDARSFKVPPGNHPDGKVPGLQLQVGARLNTYSLCYRQGGKQKRKVIGHSRKCR